jgi:hypothetical protein
MSLSLPGPVAVPEAACEPPQKVGPLPMKSGQPEAPSVWHHCPSVPCFPFLLLTALGLHLRNRLMALFCPLAKEPLAKLRMS